MNVDSLHKKAAQLLTEVKEREAAQRHAVIVFYDPEEPPPELEHRWNDDGPTPSDDAPGAPFVRFYLPIKQQLSECKGGTE